jgi:hypothetical protein
MLAVFLLDDFDDPAGSRIDQNRSVVHDRIAIFASAVFPRDVVISNAFLGQDRADPDFPAIAIRRVTPLDDIAVEAGALIDSQNTGHSSDDTTYDTADDRTDGAGGSFAISRASLNSARYPLRLRHYRERHGGNERNNSDESADHDIS